MNAHRWRTLVRVLVATDEGVWCVFPAWESRTAVLIDSAMFGGRTVETNFRFHAEVTLNAGNPNDLNPDKFEFPAS